MKTNEQLKTALLQEAEQAMLEMIEHLQTVGEGDMLSLEQQVLTTCLSLGRSVIEQTLNHAGEEAERKARRDGECGHRQRLVGMRPKQLHTLMGKVTVRRAYYQCVRKEGEHHETVGAFDDEGALVSALRGLASTGVAVVAAAGNGASDVEFYPGAFSQSSSFDVPLVSVGAHNPGGRQPHLVPPGRPTVSVYSNTGRWVTTYRCGTAVVSTMPVTFDGSIRSVLFQPGSPNPTRGSIDLDDYSGGFGQWSGTSFAAPALAGDIARRIFGTAATDPEAEGEEDEKPEPLTDDLVEQRVRRAAEAVALAVKEGS